MLDITISTSRRLRQRMRGELSHHFANDHSRAYQFCVELALFADRWESWHEGIFVLDPGLSRFEMSVDITRANDSSNRLVFYVDTPAKPKSPDEAESVLVTAQFLVVDKKNNKSGTVAKFYFRVQGGVVTMFEPSRRKLTANNAKPRTPRSRRAVRHAKAH